MELTMWRVAMRPTFLIGPGTSEIAQYKAASISVTITSGGPRADESVASDSRKAAAVKKRTRLRPARTYNANAQSRSEKGVAGDGVDRSALPHSAQYSACRGLR